MVQKTKTTRGCFGNDIRTMRSVGEGRKGTERSRREGFVSLTCQTSRSQGGRAFVRGGRLRGSCVVRYRTLAEPAEASFVCDAIGMKGC